VETKRALADLKMLLEAMSSLLADLEGTLTDAKSPLPVIEIEE
jgi:hypothetical protein